MEFEPWMLLIFPLFFGMGWWAARLDIKDLLSELIDLRKNLASDGFLEAWQTALAFRGENVHIWQGHSHSYTAELLGLASDGSLRVRLPDGGLNIIHFGEVHLRPLVE